MKSRDVVRQSVKFWNGPWMMNSVWEDGRGVIARFFVENDALQVEVEVTDAWHAPIMADASAKKLILEAESQSVQIPLPEEVVPGHLELVKGEGGAYCLTLTRRGLKGQLPQ